MANKKNFGKKKEYSDFKREKSYPEDRRNSKGKSKGKPKESKTNVEPSAEGNNDPNWYIPDPIVMEQATRISFDDFIGVPIEMDSAGQIGLSKSTLKPGAIMQVFMNPCPGWTGRDNPKVAAINQQGFRTYARLSSINAKNTNYLPNDVTTMILAMGELISLISVAQRAYGLLWSYNIRNRTQPSLLVEAAGLLAPELRSAAAPYLIRLNTLLVEANKIPFPSNIDYFKRCNEIYSSVYRDSNSDMSETYVPIPASTWDLAEDELIEGTYLKTHLLYNTGSSYHPMIPDQLLDIIEDKINAMLTSATYNYVYSDIINLSTKDPSVKLLQFVPVDFNYAVMPIVDPEWLLKINNATLMGKPLDEEAWYPADATDFTPNNDVLPDPDSLCLIYAPQFEYNQPSLAMDKLINFYTDQPTMQERLIATRYHSAGPLQRLGEVDPLSELVAYGYYTGIDNGVALSDHYVVGLNIYTDDIEEPELTLYGSGVIDTVDETNKVSILTRFSQHPYIYEFNQESPSMMQSLEGMVGDLEFFTNMDFQTLSKINKLALFAMFDVKDVTKDK